MLILDFHSRGLCQNDPHNSQPQPEINKSAITRRVLADKELNEVYKKIVDKLEQLTQRARKENNLDFEKESKQEKDIIIDSQRKWLEFRDSYCKIYTELYKGGSMMLMMVDGCATRLTKDRTKELKKLLNELNK